MDQVDIVAEYARRLVDEVPALVRRGVDRARRLDTVNADRIVEGVIAHSISLPSLQEALADRTGDDDAKRKIGLWYCDRDGHYQAAWRTTHNKLPDDYNPGWIPKCPQCHEPLEYRLAELSALEVEDE